MIALSHFLLAAGKSLAIRYGCKYIETSPGINHNVDELLVGMLAQIELREEAAEKGHLSREGGGGGGGRKQLLGEALNLISPVVDGVL